MSSIRDLKITPQQIAEKGVIASPDTLTGTPDENKSVFDRLASEIIVPAVNGAIEMLGDVEDDTLEWASDEAQRQANESARQSAEDARVQAEKGRVSAETGRVSAESSRASAESARGTAEDARVQAEKGRASAESGRVTTENGRVSAESARATAEQQRAKAEGEREDAEDARELAEQQRADETAGIVAQATAQAGEAADSATLSQSWARGGTGTRSGENTNNAKYFSEQAQASAAGASTSAGAAAGSASTAQSAASQAQGAKTDAEDAAQRAEQAAEDAEASAASALQSASNAEQSKNAAAQSKSDAATSAQQSAASASAASQSASESEESKAAAASSASSASGSASAAAASEQSALESKNSASASAQAASASATAAAASQASAAESNTAAQSAAARAEQAAEDAEAIAGGDFIPNSQKGAPGGVATLGDDGKVPAAQLPEMDYDPAGSAAAVQANLTSHTGNTNNPHNVTASQVGAVPTTRKVNGKTLSSDITLSSADVGAISNPADGEAGQILTKTETGAEWGDLGASGGSLLTITFDTSFSGLPYTITGGEESYSGTVPTSLEAVHSLLAVNTVYTLSIQNETFTITTDDYYTALELTAEPSTPIDVPTVTGTLTYTGEAQSPAWSGYDEEEMTIGGETSGTNAGTYTATFTPNAGYKWSDGTNTAKSVQWSIGKATPTLTLSPTSLSLVGTTPKTSAISYNGDGALTAQSNNTGVATVSLSGTTLSVTAVASGSTTITVTAAAGTNYNSASATLSVSAIYAVSFATDSWDTIAAAAEAGIASQYYSVGDTKNIAISGVGTITLEIADFDHDYLSGSTSAQKAGISMITRDLLPGTRQMNGSDTNVGGFPASALYDYLNGTILNGLPSDLRSALKTIYKWYGTGNSTTNGQWHGCKVWVPLEYELFGDETYAPTTERTTGNARKYPIFTDKASRVKKMNNGSGSANYYWEASPHASNAAYFCNVHSNGSASIYFASAASGVCFGLSI